MAQPRAAVILAAGKGKRMKSDLPKVLHPIKGKPMIQVLLDTLTGFGLDRTVVVIGHKGEMVESELSGYPVSFAWQREQLGTGHAVLMTAEAMKDFVGTTLVAMGDVPFLSASSVEALFDVHRRSGAAATCLSAIVDDATGYGRIVRDGDLLREVVEHKDASEEVLAINEINTGTFCFDNQALFSALAEVGNDNAQGEYYLPDAIKILRARGLKVAVVTADDPDEVLGVNSVDQLEQLAAKFADRNG